MKSMRSNSVVQIGKPMSAIPVCVALFIGSLFAPVYGQAPGGFVAGAIHVSASIRRPNAATSLRTSSATRRFALSGKYAAT